MKAEENLRRSFMVNPLHNNIFFDDYHRFVLQDALLPTVSKKIIPKRPFKIGTVDKSKKSKEKEASNKNPDSASEGSESIK
jgi:hypothetical protein